MLSGLPVRQSLRGSLSHSCFSPSTEDGVGYAFAASAAAAPPGPATMIPPPNNTLAYAGNSLPTLVPIGTAGGGFRVASPGRFRVSHGVPPDFRQVRRISSPSESSRIEVPIQRGVQVVCCLPNPATSLVSLDCQWLAVGPESESGASPGAGS